MQVLRAGDRNPFVDGEIYEIRAYNPRDQNIARGFHHFKGTTSDTRDPWSFRVTEVFPDDPLFRLGQPVPGRPRNRGLSFMMGIVGIIEYRVSVPGQAPLPPFDRALAAAPGPAPGAAPGPPPRPVRPGTVLPARAVAFPGNPAEGKLKEFDRDEDCPICLATKLDRPRYVGPCGHSIHEDEYDRLLMNPKTCPKCVRVFGGRRKSRKSKKGSRKTRRRY